MLYQIGDFLKRVRVPVIIEDDKVYRLVTIRMNHKGVVQREEKSGSAIGTKTMYRVTAGQFILSGIDARNGAFGIVPDELDGAVVTNDFWYFEIDNTIISKNYFLYLTSTPLFADIVRKASDGTTNRVRLQADKFYTYQVDLPDVSNQDEVIEKVVQHEAAIRTIQAELQTQQNLLAKLRQSILQEAVQGKLTERWRAERNGLKQAGAGQVAGSNPVEGSANESQTVIDQPVTPGGTGSGPVRTATQSDETGAELLARIRAEKAELIRQGKLRKEKPLPPITDAEKPFELPDGWVWCRLGEISTKTDSGWSPACNSTAASENVWGVLKTTSVQEMLYLQHENKELPARLSPRPQYQVEAGDILITRAGPKNRVGVCCVVKETRPKLMISDKIVRIHLHESLTNANYVGLSLNIGASKDYIEDRKTGMADSQVNVSQDNLKLTPIPFPPLAEQQTIVAQVDEALAHLSELESENRQQQEEVGRLMQAVLREAFAGKEVVIN